MKTTKEQIMKEILHTIDVPVENVRMNQQLVYAPLAEPFVMGVMSVVAVILC